eukprot:1694810-Pyramimonas_sp.AAC.1
MSWDFARMTASSQRGADELFMFWRAANARANFDSGGATARRGFDAVTLCFQFRLAWRLGALLYQTGAFKGGDGGGGREAIAHGSFIQVRAEAF